MPKHKNTSVTREDFMHAFNSSRRKQEICLGSLRQMPQGQHKKLRSQLSASCKRIRGAFSAASKMPANKLRLALLKATSFPRSVDASYSLLQGELLKDIANAIPELKTSQEKAIRREELRREKALVREAQALTRKMNKPKSIRQRLAGLEEENARLRSRIDSRPQTAEDREAEAKRWERADAGRMGGYVPPPVSGFRD